MLEAVISSQLSRPVPAEIQAIVREVAVARPGVVAVLGYGSCLRGVPTSESLIDLYVLTEDLHGVSGSALARMGCRLAPPNVHYVETEHDGQTYRAKYAILPIARFRNWMTADNPYFWARFAQPSRLVMSRDDKTREEVFAAIAQAVRTMLAAARSVAPGESDALQLWTSGFAATYGTELRVETASRARSIVMAEPAYYAEAADAAGEVAPLAGNWALRRLKGKLWSVARLSKAAFTFSGGAEYLAWKIERHSGHKVELSDWQKRHPVIAGLALLPQLLWRGTVR
jgi:hypothetical protein